MMLDPCAPGGKLQPEARVRREEAFHEALWQPQVGANTARIEVPRLQLGTAGAKEAVQRIAVAEYHSARTAGEGEAQQSERGMAQESQQCQSARTPAISTPRGRINCSLPMFPKEESVHKFIQLEPYKNHKRSRFNRFAGTDDCEQWKQQVDSFQQDRNKERPQVDTAPRIFQHEIMRQDCEKHKMYGFAGPPDKSGKSDDKNVIYFVGRESKGLAGASKMSLVNFRNKPTQPARPNPTLLGQIGDKPKPKGRRSFGRRMHVPSTKDGPFSDRVLTGKELLQIPLMPTEPKPMFVGGKNVRNPLSVRRFSEFLIGP